MTTTFLFHKMNIVKLIKTTFYLVSLILLLGHQLNAQNTIGLLDIDYSKVSDGYILLNPENQSTVFLINNCGEVVHSWEKDDDVRLPGKEQYLDEDGRLYLASIQPSVQGQSFGAGGAGGVLEILDWDGSVEWQYVVADSLQRQHHDIHIMPNGNIMFIAWERIPLELAAEHGFDTLNSSQIGFWPDKIVEVNPSTNEVVWEWRTFDHMVQDIDSSLMNYGVISEHPERININYIDFAFGRQDVHHVNSIDYNEDLDMVMISVRNFNEIWIIDHSTTIEEASSTSGGLRGLGGDLLYRWGNPAAYDSGEADDQKLFRQHDASWIDEVPEDHPYYGQVSIYNNFIAPELSLGAILNPIFNSEENSFEKEGNLFLPIDFTTVKSHPIEERNFSTAASNIQILANGNTLMCAARQGRMFEITESGDLAWEYLVPMRGGLPIPQGQQLSLSDNFTFSGRRYGSDFSGFQNKDLTPKGFIELEPNEDLCTISSIDNEVEREGYNFSIHPNPVRDVLILSSDVYSDYKIFDVVGNIVFKTTTNSKQASLNLDSLSKGIYFIQSNANKEIQKFIKL